MSDTPYQAQLRSHYLFSALTEEEFGRVIRNSRVHELESSEHLFYQGKEADRFFLVLRGQIKLTRLTPDGNEKVIEILMPGQTFAEAVMFMNREEYPVTATAITPATVYAVQNRTFMEVLRNNNDACIRLLGDVATRLHNRLQEIENLTMKNATYRVVRYFLNEWERQPGDQQRVELPIQKQLIASRLSIKPETLSRILSALRDQGIIESQGKEVIITDIKRLKDYE